MSRTIWVAVAAAVIALGAAGCGTSDADTGAAAPSSPSPRPKGTGPLPEKVVRTDLDTSTADAGVPANAPDFARSAEERSDGSPASCTVAFKGFGTKSTPVDLSSFEGVVSELGERDWQLSRKREDRKRKDGDIAESRTVLKQRGWTLIANYLVLADNGVITLFASEDACIKKIGADAGLLG
ncbi:hypothetical protein [Streptomyces sp. NPDC090132]|uniref:hypothetical protein n=1 Tax=Streptomyces sp. NPDC090132 TaxID=3365955 RepID=UPI0038205063